ncbi:hypothetical protein KI387_012633, partial [Taxus chinensis]
FLTSRLMGGRDYFGLRKKITKGAESTTEESKNRKGAGKTKRDTSHEKYQLFEVSHGILDSFHVVIRMLRSIFQQSYHLLLCPQHAPNFTGEIMEPLDLSQGRAGPDLADLGNGIFCIFCHGMLNL